MHTTSHIHGSPRDGVSFEHVYKTIPHKNIRFKPRSENVIMYFLHLARILYTTTFSIHVHKSIPHQNIPIDFFSHPVTMDFLTLLH